MNSQFTPMDYNINKADRNRKEQQASRNRQAQEAQDTRTRKSVNIMRVISQIIVTVK